MCDGLVFGAFCEEEQLFQSLFFLNVCVCVRESESVCVCVCERVKVCVCVCE